jgi:Type III restriction enzyme, res subunit
MSTPKHNNYGVLNAELFPAQSSAIEHGLAILKDYNAFLLIAGTGTGKTLMSCAIAKEYIKTRAHLPTYNIASCRILVVTAKSVVEQFAQDARVFFGITCPQDLRVISYGELRTTVGTQWLDRVPDESDQGADSGLIYRWKHNTAPLIIIWDECQCLNNIGSLQHQIGWQGAEINEPSPLAGLIDKDQASGTKHIYMSATPASKPIHLDVPLASYIVGPKGYKAFNIDYKSRLLLALSKNNSFHHGQSRDVLWATVMGSIDPKEPSDKGMKRIKDFLAPITHRVPFLKTKYKNKISVQLTEPSAKERLNIDKALEDYLKECKALGRTAQLEGNRGEMVARIKFRKRCEIEHAESLAKNVALKINEGKQVSVACEFKDTIARLVLYLTRDHGFSPDDIALIWGGSPEYQLGEKEYSTEEIFAELSKALRGEALDEDTIDNMIRQTKAQHSGMLDDIKSLNELGIDLTAQTNAERLAGIDMYQRGAKRICIFSFKAGSIGINLNHSRKYYLSRPLEYAVSNLDANGDFIVRHANGSLYTGPLPKTRCQFISPTWSPRNYVQAIGRLHRVDSISDAEQYSILFKGTIEEIIASNLAKNLKSMATMIQSKESWMSVLHDKSFGGYKLEDLTSVETDEVVDDQDVGE